MSYAHKKKKNQTPTCEQTSGLPAKFLEPSSRWSMTRLSRSFHRYRTYTRPLSVGVLSAHQLDERATTTAFRSPHRDNKHNDNDRERQWCFYRHCPADDNEPECGTINTDAIVTTLTQHRPSRARLPDVKGLKYQRTVGRTAAVAMGDEEGRRGVGAELKS